MAATLQNLAAQMFIRILFVLSLLGVSAAMAQQSSTSTQDLQLNLDKFPEAESALESTDLELNLDQFDKSASDGAEDSGGEGSNNLELNLEQFDSDSQSTRESSATAIDTTGSSADSPTYNYRQIFLVGGLVLLVFLYLLSRRRKR